MARNPWLVKKIGGYGLDPLDLEYSLKQEFGTGEFLEIPIELYDTYVLPAGATVNRIPFFQNTQDANGASITNNIEKNIVNSARAYIIKAMSLSIWGEEKIFEFTSIQTLIEQLFETCFLRFKMDQYDVWTLPFNRIITSYPTTRAVNAIYSPFTYIFGKEMFLRPKMKFELAIETDSPGIVSPFEQELATWLRMTLIGFEYRPPVSS